MIGKFLEDFDSAGDNAHFFFRSLSINEINGLAKAACGIDAYRPPSGCMNGWAAHHPARRAGLRNHGPLARDRSSNVRRHDKLV